MKYRKRPIVVEAIQWDGSSKSGQEVTAFGQGAVTWHFNQNTMRCDTLEGPGLHVSVGDWIIRGVEGEFYPCKPNIFEATYGPVESSPKEEA